jgi:prepilin-type processing-associated H-X9-DG protein
LNNQYTHQRNSPWRTFGKATDPGPPGPAQLWMLVDENVNSLNDAAFCFGMESPGWIDVPGSAHNRSCDLAFADGHSEIRHWLRTPATDEDMTDPMAHQDWLWMRERTSADTTGKMPAPP